MLERVRVPGGDNYSYVLYDEPAGEAVLVDPVAVTHVREVLREKSLDPKTLINTHGHGDHTSGNDAFRSDVSDVACHPEETGSINKVTRTVEHGDALTAGSLRIEILHTPGHTSGSICLKTRDVFVAGDTVFLAGCGNPKFGGDTRELFESFKETIRPLPDQLTLCPGHDYARRNLNFSRSVDPGNSAIDRKLSELDNNGEPSSTLAEEKKYNPFFRFDKPELKQQLDGLSASSSDWDVFSHLRERRNNW